ncbi:MAG: zinc ribbon domain-containing protein [Proteobacteria bacterium]|nr:zinc ribbon domain-containing protein [Pseudomonadota bacterium]
MPLFEYECNACNHTFDVLMLSSRDPEPVCPKCRHDGVKKIMSAGHILGGRSSGHSFQGASPNGGCAPSGG